MSELLIQIVDENDKVVHGGTMDEAQLGGLWHRIARVMVHDKVAGKYLLQKVAPNPYYDGGLWNTTASGHVDEGESYEQAAARETAEEMGVVGLRLVEVERYVTETTKGDKVYRRHNVTYVAETHDAPSVNPNDEVEDTVWLSRDELLKLDSSEITDGLRHFITYIRNDN